MVNPTCKVVDMHHPAHRQRRHHKCTRCLAPQRQLVHPITHAQSPPTQEPLTCPRRVLTVGAHAACPPLPLPGTGPPYAAGAGAQVPLRKRALDA
eukprot:1155518-Pelagomonas_calceolata.AAC.2